MEARSVSEGNHDTPSLTLRDLGCMSRFAFLAGLLVLGTFDEAFETAVPELARNVCLA